LDPLFSQWGAARIERDALTFEAQPPRCRGAGRGLRRKALGGANSQSTVAGRVGAKPALSAGAFLGPCDITASTPPA